MSLKNIIGKERTQAKDRAGFHTRFQLINDTTIEETDEFGHTRQFHLNKEKGTWEAEGIYPQKAELTIVGKNLFSVKESYQGSYETILYSPNRKVQEMFVQGKSGKYFLAERTDEDLNGTRDRQLFDENNQLIEQRILEKGALKKLVRGDQVLIDSTKSASLKLKNVAKTSNVR